MTIGENDRKVFRIAVAKPEAPNDWPTPDVITAGGKPPPPAN